MLADLEEFEKQPRYEPLLPPFAKATQVFPEGNKT